MSIDCKRWAPKMLLFNRKKFRKIWALNCSVSNLSDLILAKEKSPPFACNKSAMVEKKRSMVLEQNYIFQPIFFAFFAIMFNSAIFRQRLRVFRSILSSFTEIEINV